MPRSGISLVEDFEGRHAHAEFDVCCEILFGDDAEGVFDVHVCAVALSSGVAFFGDDEGGAVVDRWSCVSIGSKLQRNK